LFDRAGMSPALRTTRRILPVNRDLHRVAEQRGEPRVY